MLFLQHFVAMKIIQHFFLVTFWINLTGFVMRGTLGVLTTVILQKDMANTATLQYQVEIQCHTDSTTLYTCQVYSIYNTEITIRNLLMNMLGYRWFKQNK